MSEEKQKFHSIIKKYVNDVPYVSSGEKGVPELEIRFGTYGNKRTSRIDYDNVCKNLLSHGFKPTSKLGKSILRITNSYIDRNTGQTRMSSNIRTEITGIDLIKQYCKTNILPESKDYIQSNISPIKGFKIMLENSPFKRLIMAFMFGGIAFSITIPLYLFFITYVLKAEEMAIFMLTFFYLTNIIAVPFWVWLSKQIGKHKAYMCSFAMIAFAHPFYLLLGEGDFWWMLPITITTGFAAGGFAALPNSMKADVIDLDTVKSGENRSGLFFSSWSLTSKLAGSIGTWLALTALSWISFNTGFDADNSPSQLFGLKFLFSTLPSFFFLTAILIIWKYPITEEMHSKIRDQLKNIKNERILET